MYVFAYFFSGIPCDRRLLKENLLEEPLSKVETPLTLSVLRGWVYVSLKGCISVAQMCHYSPAESSRDCSSAAWLFLGSPIWVPEITQTLWELAISQGKVDREELWKRPFLQQEKKFLLHFFMRKQLKCPCSSWVSLAFAPATSGAGSSWQIFLP